MNFFTHKRLKYIAYALELLLVFIIQCTPNLLPEFLGVRPMLMLVFAMGISMFESEGTAMWFGLAAGLLMDLASAHVFGFFAVIFTVCCYASGALVVFLMRNNLLTCVILTLGSLLISGLLQWFFFYLLWGDEKAWYYLYAIMLPQIVYSAVFVPVAFYFNRALATHLTDSD
ncbi:MAG: rod shape-determining protein MreD [Clostridia bacterium]|nr:rod shape-determining protein MreD [Oscillospiraceae bacterium]MBQ6796457.1 rod shape-determining protein MreD [Clostridia bacterium]